MSRFDEETAVVADGDGRWRCRIGGAWNIGTTPNGGYALTPVVRALRELAGMPDPLSLTAHFLRPALADTDGVVEGRLLRRGRTTATATASLFQDGAERIAVVATFGDVTTGAADPVIALPPPADLPGPDDCVARATINQGLELPIASRLDVRIHPDDAGGTDPSGRGEVRGWIRFADTPATDTHSSDTPATGNEPVDTVALPLLADAFPPTLFTALGPVGWVPTVELTVHVRRRPVPGWIRARFVCDDLAGGRMIETGVLWDEGGAVVARSRQLGLLLPN